MKIAVLGTGVVGQTVSEKLAALGHEVLLGTRDAAETRSRTEINPMTGRSFADWYSGNQKIQVVNYEDIPADTDLFVNATSGGGSLPALHAVGKNKLAGKVMLDIANPLDFSQGMPPSLSVCNTDSLAEHLQREFPEARIVKTLNTMSAALMVNPGMIPGDHSVFMSGNDVGAKNEVRALLHAIGWTDRNIIDVGDISTARGTEMLLPIWVRLYGALGTPMFNFNIVRA